MPDIAGSVGVNGRNDESDTLTVQTLLNQVPAMQGGAEPVLDLDGWCGNKTVAAIRKFQQRQFNSQDGLVEPGKRTIQKLNALATAPGARPVPAPDMDPKTLAMQSAPQVTRWITAALKEINEVIAGGGALAGRPAYAQAAFAAHFKLTDRFSANYLLKLLATVKSNYEAAQRTVNNGAAIYRSVSRKQMSIDMGGQTAPAYVPNRQRICFTPEFHVFLDDYPARPGMDWSGQGWGPKCRAAMVLHETIHYVDPQAQFDIYEHDQVYQTMIAEVAIHDPSSYPSFAAHIEERSPLPMGPLYGAGRPRD